MKERGSREEERKESLWTKAPLLAGLEPRGHVGSGGGRRDLGAWREGLGTPTAPQGVF